MNSDVQLAHALLATTRTLLEYVAARNPAHCAGLSRMLLQQADQMDKAGMHIAAEHLRDIQDGSLSEAASDRRAEARRLIEEPPAGSA